MPHWIQGNKCFHTIYTVVHSEASLPNHIRKPDPRSQNFYNRSSRSSDLVPHDRLRTKIAASCVVLRIVIWIREFVLGHMQSVRFVGQLSEEVRVTSVVLQGSALCPLLFLAYINDIWKNNESTIRLFMDNCVIYRRIVNNNDVQKLQIWADWRSGWWKMG